ncbi:hypothetical protein KQI52_16645 [bacterium]|nr:hypothetical protein [bacterium]
MTGFASGWWGIVGSCRSGEFVVLSGESLYFQRVVETWAALDPGLKSEGVDAVVDLEADDPGLKPEGMQ